MCLGFRLTYRIQNPDIPWAGQSRGQASFSTPKVSEKRHLNVPPEAGTSEILCKQMGEQNPRLTRCWPAVYLQFTSGTRSALCSWLLTSGPTLFCICEPFSYKACPGTSIGETTLEHVFETWRFDMQCELEDLICNVFLEICYRRVRSALCSPLRNSGPIQYLIPYVFLMLSKARPESNLPQAHFKYGHSEIP